MGQVYTAYDPKLDRKIALKVLHEERDGRDDPRLVREAQALARLAHPNVVAVHDVGMHDGRLFVAMEFVEGLTLREWFSEHPPRSSERLVEVLELLIQAGEGLAAAHRAELVHRDFKPSNVLIGSDGRVRVVDFGVARVEPLGAGQENSHLDSLLDESTTEPRLEQLDPLTRPGALVGTPAYMAPEQLLSTKVQAASDQFGFCLTAWEGIFGVRPFPGKTIPALLEVIRKGQPVRPSARECPRELEAALRKGLAFGPRRRHANMDALLAELRASHAALRGEARPSSRRRPWVVGSIVLGAAIAATYGFTREGERLCTGAKERLVGVWDEGVRAELRQAFQRTGAEFARDAWTRFEGELDGYADAWTAGHRDACEAAQVRKVQSTELMDLRMACLDARRRDLVALTEVYASADVDMIARADDAIAELDPVVGCADVEYVRHRGSLPEGTEQAARGEAVLASVSRSSALTAAGQYAEALEQATAAVADADALDFTPIAARAHLQLGKVNLQMRRGEAAREELEHAYLLGSDAHVPEVKFDASRLLVVASGRYLLRFSEARWWAKVAQFEAKAVDDDVQQARLRLDLGSLARAEGRFVDAEERFEEAVELLRPRGPAEHVLYANALVALGDLRTMTGGPDRGLPLLEEALSIAEHKHGPEHPRMAEFHRGLAKAHRFRGDLDRALQYAQRAMASSEAAFGPDHVALYLALDELSSVLSDRGDVEAAIALLGRARDLAQPEPLADAIRAGLFAQEGGIRYQQQSFDRAVEMYRKAESLSARSVGGLHPDTVGHRLGLGGALSALGHREQGRALMEAALSSGQALLGSDHPDLALTYDALAKEMERSGDLEKALEYETRAHEINMVAYGKDSIPVMRSHGNLCALLGHLGRVKEAISHCERALELAERAISFDDNLIAMLRNNLGAALVAAGRHQEALPHYQRARETWERGLGERDIHVAMALANIAEVHEARGRPTEARRAYAESLEIREERLGKTHSMLVVPLVGLANVSTAQGRLDEAAAFARRALEIAVESRVPELTLARAQAALARALLAKTPRSSEAVELAKEAARVFEVAGAEATRDRARMAEWFPPAG